MDGYQEIRKLGAGSFGVALLVRRRADGELVVSKRMRLCGLGQKEREDALNEVRCLSKIQHAYVTRYHESLFDKGFLNIIMEYAPNGDLAGRIRAQRAPQPTPFGDSVVMKWVLQLLVALDFVHEECRILHRDLKPQNIFLGSDDVIKLGDLGIAKTLDKSLDMARTMVGTPYYMSPELCRNERYGFKSDIWALGCVAYELVTLSRPFEGNNLSALVLQIVTAQPRPLHPTASGPPQLHAAITNSLLHKDASARTSARKLLQQKWVGMWAESLNDALLSSLLPPLPPAAPSKAPAHTTPAHTTPHSALKPHSAAAPSKHAHKRGTAPAPTSVRYGMYGAGVPAASPYAAKLTKCKKADGASGGGGSGAGKGKGKGKCGGAKAGGGGKSKVVGSYLAGLVGNASARVGAERAVRAERAESVVPRRAGGDDDGGGEGVLGGLGGVEGGEDDGFGEGAGERREVMVKGRDVVGDGRVDEVVGKAEDVGARVKALCEEKRTREAVLLRERVAKIQVEARIQHLMRLNARQATPQSITRPDDVVGGLWLPGGGGGKGGGGIIGSEGVVGVGVRLGPKPQPSPRTHAQSEQAVQGPRTPRADARVRHAAGPVAREGLSPQGTPRTPSKVLSSPQITSSAATGVAAAHTPREAQQGTPATPQPVQEAATPEGLRAGAHGQADAGEARASGRAVNRQRWRPLVPPLPVAPLDSDAPVTPFQPAAPVTGAARPHHTPVSPHCQARGAAASSSSCDVQAQDVFPPLGGRDRGSAVVAWEGDVTCAAVRPAAEKSGMEGSRGAGEDETNVQQGGDETNLQRDDEDTGAEDWDDLDEEIERCKAFHDDMTRQISLAEGGLEETALRLANARRLLRQSPTKPHDSSSSSVVSLPPDATPHGGAKEGSVEFVYAGCEHSVVGRKEEGGREATLGEGVVEVAAGMGDEMAGGRRGAKGGGAGMEESVILVCFDGGDLSIGELKIDREIVWGQLQDAVCGRFGRRPVRIAYTDAKGQAHLVSNQEQFARCIRAALEEKRNHGLDLEIDVIFDQPLPHASAEGTCHGANTEGTCHGANTCSDTQPAATTTTATNTTAASTSENTHPHCGVPSATSSGTAQLATKKPANTSTAESAPVRTGGSLVAKQGADRKTEASGSGVDSRAHRAPAAALPGDVVTEVAGSDSGSRDRERAVRGALRPLPPRINENQCDVSGCAGGSGPGQTPRAEEDACGKPGASAPLFPSPPVSPPPPLSTDGTLQSSARGEQAAVPPQGKGTGESAESAESGQGWRRGGLWERMQRIAVELSQTLGRACLEEAYLAAKDGREEDVRMCLAKVPLHGAEFERVLEMLQTLLFCEENYAAQG